MSTGQRQDSLTDQMRDVMAYAVKSGCYDAHDWLVARWGTRNGICGDNLDTGMGGMHWCTLTIGHEGAHGDSLGAHWQARVTT